MKKKITNKQFAEALYEAAVDLKGGELQSALRQFVLLLGKHRKLKQAERIIAEFEKYSKRRAGVVDIEIKTSRQLDEDSVEKIKKFFGNKVDAVEAVDESLLGGVVVRTEEKILDGSLRTQLGRLKQGLL
ncbi:MAG: F0F1 ATP synthase subunit delta [Candidatus Magasanikbacteria bacterium]|nr:F0F1 ATP synthase subunit delta [Candidatus Magasanikbacteria bacterium]